MGWKEDSIGRVCVVSSVELLVVKKVVSAVSCACGDELLFSTKEVGE